MYRIFPAILASFLVLVSCISVNKNVVVVVAVAVVAVVVVAVVVGVGGRDPPILYITTPDRPPLRLLC